MEIFALKYLSKVRYNQLKKRFKRIQFIEIQGTYLYELAKKDGVELIDGSNLTKTLNPSYELYQKRLKTISKNKPWLTTISNTDITNCIVKKLLWSRLHKEGVSLANNVTNQNASYIIDKPSIKSKLKNKLKILSKIILKKPQIALDIDSQNISGKLLIDIQNKLHFSLNENIIDCLPKGSFAFCTFSTDLEIPKKYIDIPLIKISLDDFSSTNYESIDHLLSIAVSSDSEFLLDVLEAKNSLRSYDTAYRLLFSKKPRGIYFIAGENQPNILLACQIAKNLDIVTFNYMNGMKGKTANNLDTLFDYWFMHDQYSRDMLLDFDPNLSIDQCPVVGHMEQDYFAQLAYDKSTSNPYLDIDKKVITIFSSPLYFKEQKDLMELLVSYSNKSDVQIYFKLHPSQKVPIIPLSDSIELLSSVDKVTNRQLILASNLVVTFASTVSIEAAMANANVWNIEYRTESVIPSINQNHTINHVKTKESIETEIHNLDSYTLDIKINSQEFVYERISKILMSNK